ncbi:MAG: hypothetical protein OHK0053_24170 [Microscillaceae bacterium]
MTSHRLKNKIRRYIPLGQILESPLKTATLVLVLVSAVVGGLSWPYYQYDFKNFYPQILAEAHGMVFDIAVIGILLFWLNKRGETRRQIRTYLDEIDDFRRWQSEEAAFRTAGNIKRLNRHRLFALHLAECYLVRTNMQGVCLSQANLNLANLREANLVQADLQEARLNRTCFVGANLSQANFKKAQANGADFCQAFLMETNFQEAYLIKANFKEAALMEANLRGAELSEACFEGANLLRADLRGAKGLTASQLGQAKNLHLTQMDEHIWQQLCHLYPLLAQGS